MHVEDRDLRTYLGLVVHWIITCERGKIRPAYILTRSKTPGEVSWEGLVTSTEMPERPCWTHASFGRSEGSYSYRRILSVGLNRSHMYIIGLSCSSFVKLLYIYFKRGDIENFRNLKV